jgi:hypothetical protein
MDGLTKRVARQIIDRVGVPGSHRKSSSSGSRMALKAFYGRPCKRSETAYGKLACLQRTLTGRSAPGSRGSHGSTA